MKKNVNVKSFHQGFLIDHHTPPPPVGSFKGFDIRNWIEAIEIGDVYALMVYCKDHYGLAYYPTKVGQCHEALEIDLIGEISKALKERGKEFIAYYSVGFDEHAALNHDDWALRRTDGTKYRISRPPVPKWHSCCTQTGYLHYMMDQLTEIITAYNPDRIFLDITKHGGVSGYGQDNLPLCYCDICRAKFQERYGVAMPETEDEIISKAMLIQDWEDEVLDYDTMKALTDLIYKLSPDCLVNMNEMIHFKKKTRDLFNCFMSEISFGQWFTPLYARGLAKGREFMVGPIAQSPSFDPLPASVYDYGTACAVSQGAAAFEFSCQHGNASADMIEFKNIGVANRELKKYENLLENRHTIKDIAILLHEETYTNLPNQLNPKRMAAAMRYADYCKRPLEIIIDDDLCEETLSKYNVLLVPSGGCVCGEQAEIIRDFVKKGGVLISAGDFSLKTRDGVFKNNFELADVLGCDFESLDCKYITNQYGSYLDASNHFLAKHIIKTNVPFSAPAYKVNLNSGEALGCHQMPTVVYEPGSWWNWSSPPPGVITNSSAIVYNAFGKGHSIYFAAEIFEELSATQYSPGQVKFNWIKTFIKGSLDDLKPVSNIAVACPVPESVGFSFWRTNNEKKIIIHAVNQTIRPMKGDVNKIETGIFLLNKAVFNVESAEQIYPESKALTLERDGDLTSIHGGEVGVHSIFTVKLR